MALIAACCWDTEENNRSKTTYEFLVGLTHTVDFNRHRLVLIDQNSCERTKILLKRCTVQGCIMTGYPEAQVITLPENIGTARGINKGWALRRPGEHVVKMDNDCILQNGWLDDFEEIVALEPKIGIVCGKRGALTQSPLLPVGHPDRTVMMMLSHDTDDRKRWHIVEKTTSGFGTCQLYSSALIDAIGGLAQPACYGWDDSLASIRCQVAGFWEVFATGVRLDYLDLDAKGTSYQNWKEAEAGRTHAEFEKMANEYRSGLRSIHVPLEAT